MIEDAGEEDDLTKTFTTEHLAGVALTVAEGLTIHSQLFLKFGLVRVMVELAPLVVEGMDVADLPREDFVVLQMAGRPLAEMEEIVEHTKQNVSRLTEDLRDLKSALSEANEQISELGGQLSNATPKNPPKRRWFKGIAKIGSGILLAGVNGSVLVGIIAVPTPLMEYAVVGGLVSITNGWDRLFTGWGELRGE